MTSGQRLPRALLVVLLLGIYSTLGVVRVVSNALRDANLLRVSVAVVFGLVLTALAVVVLGLFPSLMNWLTEPAGAALMSIFQ